MQVILPIIVTFILSGLIGNHLLQQWQTRTWLLQQRFLGHEKEYVALKELTDEIATLLGVRIFHMQRLSRTLISGDETKIELRLQDYAETVKRWNERLTSFYVRLPMLAGNEFAQRLENSIQAQLVKTGEKIEEMVAQREAKTPVTATTSLQVGRDLIAIQGKAIAFNKALLNFVHSKRSDVYFGKRVYFSSETISHFSTWHLVKALFVSNVDSLSVIRTPLDS